MPAPKKIIDLNNFTKHFFAKCKLAEMISRYMVLIQTEQKILMMRPYQIYAVKNIIQKIDAKTGNGYIWHTTGSGKTLTSFKASTLLADYDDIYKCCFVVDRKDLDSQTRDEFNKFEPNCVEQNDNTHALVKRMLSDYQEDKVIVTTIQKLGRALDDKGGHKESLENIKNERIIFIFDECHRSQFGDNNEQIRKFFPNAQLFGFTGTPIFEENATQTNIENEILTYAKTESIFETELHAYTIGDAIDDKNVLGFRYESPDEKIENKNRIVQSILDKHMAVTNNRQFNALFATNSINDAIEYYDTFKREQDNLTQENPAYCPLNIACIFSPPGNISKEAKQMQEDLLTEQRDNKTDPDKKNKH